MNFAKPTAYIITSLQSWGVHRNVRVVAQHLHLSPHTVATNLRRAREHYNCTRTVDAYTIARALEHIPTVLDDRVGALEQIVRSLLCHDPQVPQLLGSYYETWGRSLLEVPSGTV